MDIGLKQPLEKIADPDADMIVSGSMTKEMVNPVVFAAKPGNAVILEALNKMIVLGQGPYEFWRMSVCKNLWLALNDEFAGKFEPSNVVAMKTSPHGIKVQMLQERWCLMKLGATGGEDLIADNEQGCQMGLGNLAPHRDRE